MALFQMICMVFLPIAYIVQIRIDRESARLAPIIFIAAWIGESSSVNLYHFYEYSQAWWFRIGGVPLLVPVIWPLVILSGREVIRSLFPAVGKWQSAMVGVLVFVDAAMVEVTAVNCGLWSWFEPGYLGVPLIGVVGWAMFAFAVVYLITALEGAARWLIVIGAPAMLHVMLISGWWVLFRWALRGDWFWLFVAVIAVFTIAAIAVRQQRRMTMQLAGVRMIAAGIFIGLLLFTEPGHWRVWLHIGLTSIPYALSTKFTYK